MSCPADLQCVDGQCSKHCSNDDTCVNLNREATCEQQPSGVNACEVACTDDIDCTQLRSELSCNDGVCRGPLWNLDTGPKPDSGNDTTEESDASAQCPPHPGCPPSEVMYFPLPLEGLGDVRLEFLFIWGEGQLTRCTVVFEDDVMAESSCESDTVSPATLEAVCPPDVNCPSGALQFAVPQVDFEVRYWQNDGYQSLPLGNTSWEQVTYDFGPTDCGYSCSITHMSRALPSTKGTAACLDFRNECSFGLGCGDRESALSNAPGCDDETASVRQGEGCGYDILVHQRYLETEMAFYERTRGARVGFWRRSDTFEVTCGGQVPLDCINGVTLTNVCEISDAGAQEPNADGGSNDVAPEDASVE